MLAAKIIYSNFHKHSQPVPPSQPKKATAAAPTSTVTTILSHKQPQIEKLKRPATLIKPIMAAGGGVSGLGSASPSSSTSYSEDKYSTSNYANLKQISTKYRPAVHPKPTNVLVRQHSQHQQSQSSSQPVTAQSSVATVVMDSSGGDFPPPPPVPTNQPPHQHTHSYQQQQTAPATVPVTILSDYQQPLLNSTNKTAAGATSEMLKTSESRTLFYNVEDEFKRKVLVFQ
jgi:hypothetical protein